MAKARSAEEAVQRLSAARQRLLGERLVVVVCGEFKRGKSSLLNALLEEPGLFPVDSFYATSLITTASYAPEESVTVAMTSADGEIRQLAIQRDEIAAYATESGNPKNVKRVQLITIQTPNPRLAAGLTFVDTPGVGGIYEEHSAVTLGFLQNASALVFVADATQPLLESELDFIRRANEAARVTEDTDGQIFVLTKIDAVGDFDAILANTTAKLAEVTGRPADAIPLVPVSARAKLDYLRNRSDDYLELSNFAMLEQLLWSALDRRRARALLSAALADLDRAAQALLVPIETEARALSGEDRELTVLTVRTEDRAAWLTELRTNKDTWRSDLADQLGKVLTRQQQRGQQELDDVWRNCENVYLRDDRYLSAPDLLLNQVITDAGAAFATVSELAARAAARALQDFSARHGLELRRPEIGQLPAPPVPLTHLSADLPKNERTASGFARLTRAATDSQTGSKAGFGIGLTVGGIVGSVVPGVGTLVGMNVGGLVGFTLGTTVGTLAGYKAAVSEAADKGVQLQRDRLSAELEPLRRAQERHLADGLADLMGDYITAAARELDSRIAQEHESVAESLTRLTTLRDRAEAAAAVRRAELASEEAPLDQALEHIGRLAAAAAALGGAS